MIRDPSDGSVREITGAESQKSAVSATKPPVISGLPAGSTKPEQIARLNESRKWLADYHAKKSEGAKE